MKKNITELPNFGITDENLKYYYLGVVVAYAGTLCPCSIFVHWDNKTSKNRLKWLNQIVNKFGKLNILNCIYHGNRICKAMGRKQV